VEDLKARSRIISNNLHHYDARLSLATTITADGLSQLRLCLTFAWLLLASKLVADIKRMQIANRSALDEDLSFIIATSASSFYIENIGLMLVWLAPVVDSTGLQSGCGKLSTSGAGIYSIALVLDFFPSLHCV
jgi:hypothetical protein